MKFITGSSAAAAVAMLLAMAGTLYPIPASPYNILPYLYLAYLALGLTVSHLTPKHRSVSCGR
jgi:hypothetical protein